ncbi:MAG: S-layer homology domain-containing protein [Clostridia bacterium]|nr:S-layer homology domain-containing protein [Clostridia bacterium]
MKKIFICLLAFVFSVNTLVLATDISVDFSLRTVNVTVTDNLGVENPTLQLFTANKTELLYADEGTKNEDGSYSFDSFKMRDDAVSGDYVVRIGENGKLTEKTVYYPSKGEMVAMINFIKSEDFSAAGLVSTYHRILGIESNLLENADKLWIGKIETEIKKLSLDNTTDEAIINGRTDVKDTLVLWTDIIKLYTAKDKDSLDEAIAKVGGLDLKYYKYITDYEHIGKAMSSVEIDMETLTKSDVSDLFDGAILTGAIIQNDWETARDVLKYYVEKELLSVKSTYLKAGATVYKDLQSKNIIDYTKLSDELEDSYKDKNQGGSDGGSGGSGGSSGGTVVPSDKTIISGVTNSQAEEVVNNQNNAVSMFNDISSHPWAQEAIIELARMGAINGKSEKTFAPNDNITRAEFVKIIVNTFKLNDNSATVSFADVNANHWYYNAVASASKLGLVNGMNENNFGALENISREDMAVIASRLIELLNIKKAENKVEFSDKNDIADYAAEAIDTLSGLGIINGMGDGTFSPKTNVTRAQGAKVIYELHKISRRAE